MNELGLWTSIIRHLAKLSAEVNIDETNTFILFIYLFNNSRDMQ